MKKIKTIIHIILYLLVLLVLIWQFITVSVISCDSVSSYEFRLICAFAFVYPLCAISKHNIVKKIELILYLLVFFVFLRANLWYFRGFHERAFILVVMLCILKCFMYFHAEKQKKRYFFYSVISGFLLFFVIYFNFKNDIYLCPSTDLRYYKEDMSLRRMTESGWGIFPDTIPEEAEDIEYFYTPGGYFRPRSDTHAYLKMTVNQKYLNHLLEVSHNKDYLSEQDCSIINQNNASEYLFLIPHLEEYVEEFYGRENCILYMFCNKDIGFVIDWNEKVVKIFADYRF